MDGLALALVEDRATELDDAVVDMDMDHLPAPAKQHEADYHLSERHYGAFLRSFQPPDGVDADKVEAHFEKGVLTIKLLKIAGSQRSDRTIAIKAA